MDIVTLTLSWVFMAALMAAPSKVKRNLKRKESSSLLLGFFVFTVNAALSELVPGCRGH